VDRHVHKAGQPVDEAGKTIYGLWIPIADGPVQGGNRAVENRAAMWMNGGREQRKTTGSNF